MGRGQVSQRQRIEDVSASQGRPAATRSRLRQGSALPESQRDTVLPAPWFQPPKSERIAFKGFLSEFLA